MASGLMTSGHAQTWRGKQSGQHLRGRSGYLQQLGIPCSCPGHRVPHAVCSLDGIEDPARQDVIVAIGGPRDLIRMAGDCGSGGRPTCACSVLSHQSTTFSSLQPTMTDDYEPGHPDATILVLHDADLDPSSFLSRACATLPSDRRYHQR